MVLRAVRKSRENQDILLKLEESLEKVKNFVRKLNFVVPICRVMCMSNFISQVLNANRQSEMQMHNL